jgi:hypothetical protein
MVRGSPLRAAALRATESNQICLIAFTGIFFQFEFRPLPFHQHQQFCKPNPQAELTVSSFAPNERVQLEEET